MRGSRGVGGLLRGAVDVIKNDTSTGVRFSLFSLRSSLFSLRFSLFSLCVRWCNGFAAHQLGQDHGRRRAKAVDHSARRCFYSRVVLHMVLPYPVWRTIESSCLFSLYAPLPSQYTLVYGKMVDHSSRRVRPLLSWIGPLPSHTQQ